jgi:hypothetical protein
LATKCFGYIGGAVGENSRRDRAAGFSRDVTRLGEKPEAKFADFTVGIIYFRQNPDVFNSVPPVVIPAKAGIQGKRVWILACARMTVNIKSCGRLYPLLG